MNKKPHFLIQFVLILVAFTAILLQGFTHVVKMKPLAGYVPDEQPVDLSFKTYYDGTFQNYLTDHAKRNSGFREPCIRIYNQCLFSLFSKPTNNTLVPGLNKEMYFQIYLDEIKGKTLKDCYGSEECFKTKAQKDIEKTLVLIDSLRQHNTAFLVVEAPSKTWVYPEYMPQEYQDSIMSFCVQDYYTQLFKENGIPHIDFLSYFKSLKGKTKYPLYTRYGTHWAESTIPFVADSILSKIGSLIGQEMPHIICVDENLTTKYSKQDGELEALMNLLLPIRKPAIPQPIMTVSDTTLCKPNILVIADSYFVQLQESCFADCFDRCEYWQYNDEIITKDIEFLGKVATYPDAYKVINEVDMVLVISTSVFAYNYLFGFCETVPKAREMEIQNTIQRIKSTPAWLENVKQQAIERGVDLDEILRLNAIYAMEVDKKNEQQLQDVIKRIKNTPEWLENVKHQAKEKNISLNEMLRLNATYAIETDKQKQQN